MFREGRRKLLSNEQLTLQGAIDVLTLEEQEQKDAAFFRNTRPKSGDNVRSEEVHYVKR